MQNCRSKSFCDLPVLPCCFAYGSETVGLAESLEPRGVETRDHPVMQSCRQKKISAACFIDTFTVCVPTRPAVASVAKSAWYKQNRKKYILRCNHRQDYANLSVFYRVRQNQGLLWSAIITFVSVTFWSRKKVTIWLQCVLTRQSSRVKNNFRFYTCRKLNKYLM